MITQVYSIIFFHVVDNLNPTSVTLGTKKRLHMEQNSKVNQPIFQNHL